MNAISLSFRRHCLLQCWLRHLRVAFFGPCVLIAAIPAKAEAQYTFTLIADSTGPFRDFGSEPSPSLSEAGTVAFVANLDDGSFGVFRGNGGLVTTIATNPLPLGGFWYPSINQAGTVAFFEVQGNDVVERIVAGNGGPLTTIADIAGPFKRFAGGYSVSINSAGTVAFWAAQDSGPAGIFAGNGGATTPIFLNSPSLFANSSFSMNDAGTLAFRRSNGTGIVTANGGLITTIADSSGPLNYFGSAPSLNEAGTVAFVAGVAGIDGGGYGIYKGNGGQLTTIADLSGPFSSFNFNSNQPSINDSGMVAFGAGLDAGGGGVFIGDGTVTSKVIAVGDLLFGSTVTGAGVSPSSLNDSGQVAFAYTLANGTTGIAIANPVPEPGSATLVGAAMAAVGFTRRRRS